MRNVKEMKMKCKFKDLESGSWFLYDEIIYVKDNVGCGIRFDNGYPVLFSSSDMVTFIKSVELIYE